MAIVYQTDKRSGITYAYSSTSKWNKEKKRSESKRKLLGRVINMETKEYVPTDGRCKKRSPYLTEEEKASLDTNQDSKPSQSNKSVAQSQVSEVTNQEIYDLLLTITRDIEEIKRKIMVPEG